MVAISISNIAWDVVLDDEVALILNQYEVTCIDIAPSKYFPVPRDVSNADINKIKQDWGKRGVTLIGMQSLLFGTEGLNMFSCSSVQNEMLAHLSHICRLGGRLGVSKLVFGSPKNRDRSKLTDDETNKIAIKFFNQLGDIAKDNGVIICLEPNPPCYNANFMVNSLETARMVKLISHSNIKMQLDIGAMYINDEKPRDIISQVHQWVGHIHVSEPQLAKINPQNSYHKVIAPLLEEYLPHMAITIEMLSSSKDASLNEIESSIQFVNSIYK